VPADTVSDKCLKDVAASNNADETATLSDWYDSILSLRMTSAAFYQSTGASKRDHRVNHYRFHGSLVPHLVSLSGFPVRVRRGLTSLGRYQRSTAQIAIGDNAQELTSVYDR
jgi:hypothetical protein